MTARRLLKAGEAIREVVSMAIVTEIRDPRVQGVTVTRVEVAPDMRSAKVYLMVMGDEGRERLCLRGLEHAAGFLQHKINERIETRYTPRLQFAIDQGAKNAQEVHRILQQVLPTATKAAPEAAPEATTESAIEADDGAEAADDTANATDVN